jgi:hypothetical protein
MSSIHVVSCRAAPAGDVDVDETGGEEAFERSSAGGGDAGRAGERIWVEDVAVGGSDRDAPAPRTQPVAVFWRTPRQGGCR